MGWTADKWESIFTTHQFEFILIIPNYIKLTSDVFKLNLIINLDLFWCLVMLMISKLLSLSTWIYSVIFTSDLKFYSNWLPSDDYNFLDVIHQIVILLVNMDGLMVLDGWKNGFIWIDGLYCSLNWLHTQWKNSAWWFHFLTFSTS